MMMDESSSHEPVEQQRRTRQRANTAVLSTNEAILTIIKCAIGAASFSLPRAFQHGGVYISFFSTLALGILNAYTLLLLVDASGMASTLASLMEENPSDMMHNNRNDSGNIRLRSNSTVSEVNNEENNDNTTTGGNKNYTPLMAPIGGFTYSVTRYKRISYPEIGSIAFPTLIYTLFGIKFNVISCLISVGIVATSLGVCTAYVDFISETLPVVLRGWMRRDDIYLTRSNCPWILMPIVLLLSYLRTMKVLTLTSGLGDVAVFVGCIVVIGYGITHYSSDVTFRHPLIEWNTLDKYVGSNSFLFAVHIVILPIMHQMSWESNDLSKRNAIVKSYVFITFFNAIFGAVGFLLFASAECRTDAVGSHGGSIAIGPCDNILSNISTGSLLDAVKILVCIDLLFTMPIVLAASRVLVEGNIISSTSFRALCRWFRESRHPATTSMNTTDHQQQYQQQQPSTMMGATLSTRFSTLIAPAQQPKAYEIETGDIVLTDPSSHISTDGRLRNPVDRNILLSGPRSSDVIESSADSTISHIHGDDEDDEAKHDNTSDVRSEELEQSRRIGLDTHDWTTTADADDWLTLLCRYLTRSVLVLIVMALAVGVPNFGQVVDLVGGLVCSFTGYILPPVLYMRLRGQLFDKKRNMDQDRQGTLGAGTLDNGDNVVNDNGMGNYPLSIENMSISATHQNTSTNNNNTATEERANSMSAIVGHGLIVAFGIATMIITTVTNIIALQQGT